MIKLKKFDNKTTYMYPNGTVATPERILGDFPAIEHFAHVLEISGDVCQAVLNLNALRQMHNVDPMLEEDEAIRVIEDILNTPVEPEPTAEERIAAALEYQNMIV